LLSAVQRLRAAFQLNTNEIHQKSPLIPSNYLKREGALVLKNLYDYQEQLLQEIRVIRRVMANVKEASKVSLKTRFESVLNAPGIQTECPCSKFQFDSTMFRHSLRLSIAIVFAYLLGF
jgi:hypothetical protein